MSEEVPTYDEFAAAVAPARSYRSIFIEDLTRELFIVKAKETSGKAHADYAPTAYEAAVAVADVLGLED